MNRISLVAAMVPLLSSTAVLAQPAAYPADSLYSPLKCGSAASWDPVADAGGFKGSRDIVGDAVHPAAHQALDAQHIYLRMRLNEDPVVATGGQPPLEQFGWGVELDTDGNLAAAEYLLMTDGVQEQVRLLRVSDGAVLATWSPTLDPTKPGPTGQTFAPVFVEVKKASDGSSFGGGADYFLTMALPLADAAKVTAGAPHPLSLAATVRAMGTSSNGKTLNGDLMCSSGGAADGGPPDAGPGDAAAPSDLPAADAPPIPPDMGAPDVPAPDLFLAFDLPTPEDMTSAPDMTQPQDLAQEDLVQAQDMAQPDKPQPTDLPVLADHASPDQVPQPPADLGPSPDAMAADSASSPDKTAAQDGSPDSSAAPDLPRPPDAGPALDGRDASASQDLTFMGGGGCSLVESKRPSVDGAWLLPAALLALAARRRRRQEPVRTLP